MNHDDLAQQAAEARLEECYENFDEDDGEFCGCTTCIVREVLDAAVPDIWAGLIELLDERKIEVPNDVRALFAVEA